MTNQRVVSILCLFILAGPLVLAGCESCPLLGTKADTQADHSSQAMVDVLFSEASGHAFENDRMGFRSYSDGWALDIFGKTDKGQGLLLRRFYKLEEPYIEDIHHLSPEGMDIIHVGNSPGLGQVSFHHGSTKVIPQAKLTGWSIVSQVAEKAVVRAVAPVKLPGGAAIATRTLTLRGGQRGVDDVVTLKGQAEVIEGVTVGIGLRDFENSTWAISPEQGFFCVGGDGTEDRVKRIGLGAAFDSDRFVRIETIEGDEGGKVVILTPSMEDGQLVSRHTLAGYWDKDPHIDTLATFQEYLNALTD